MPIIVAKKLCKNFNGKRNDFSGVAALEDVSFAIEEGEKIGLIGLNGSGKTTLLRLIGGIYKPSGGEVSANGKVIPFLDFAWPKLRLSVRDNIFLGCTLYGLSSRQIIGCLSPIIEFAGLSDSMRTPVCRLSAGMRERLVISLALHVASGAQARILLVDELFSNSDVAFTEKAIEKLEEFIGMKATIVITSHNFEVMIKNCDRIIWLDNGRIAKIGESRAIMDEFIHLNKKKSGLVQAAV